MAFSSFIRRPMQSASRMNFARSSINSSINQSIKPNLFKRVNPFSQSYRFSGTHSMSESPHHQHQSSNQSNHQSNNQSNNQSNEQSKKQSNDKSNDESGRQGFWRRMYEKYAECLDNYPYSTQMATSGFLGGAGDATTQWFEHRWDREEGRMPKDWDFRRLFAVAFFGVYFMGPVGHIWYEKLDIFCHKYARSQAAMIGIKVFGDTFVFGPVCLWAFFVSVSLMEGISWKNTEQKIRRDFVPTYLVDYSMWPVVQGLNFKYIPVQHQLLVVNLMCYFDDIFLSYVQHNSLPRIFQVIEDWWERVLKANNWDSDLHELDEIEEADDKARKLQWELAHQTVNQSINQPAIKQA